MMTRNPIKVPDQMPPGSKETSGPKGSPALLQRDEVHIWPSRMEEHRHRLLEFEASLSPDERAKAAAFRFPELRESFVVWRGLLRSLLGNYLDEAPGRIEFRYNACAKPFLAGIHQAAGLHFNLAHSHGAAVFAFALDREIGVDVEFRRADCVIEDARLFSPSELQLLRELTGEERVRGFFRLWTRKEALLKAAGTGFNTPSQNDPGPDARWSVVDMECFEGYSAALAAEGAGFHIIPQC